MKDINLKMNIDYEYNNISVSLEIELPYFHLVSEIFQEAIKNLKNMGMFTVKNNEVWGKKILDHFPTLEEVEKIEEELLFKGNEIVDEIKSFNDKLKVIETLRKEGNLI